MAFGFKPLPISAVSGDQALTATKFNSATAAYGTAVVGRGAVALTATKFTSPTAAYGTAVVGHGAIALTPTLFTSAALAYWRWPEIQMQGAATGLPGTLPTNWILDGGDSGLSTQVVGIGTESGIDYVDFRVFGTPFPALDGIYLYFDDYTAALVGQSWTLSCYVSLQAGSLAGVTNLELWSSYEDSGAIYLEDGSYIDLLGIDGTLTQYSDDSTSSAIDTALTTAFLWFGFTPSSSVDITVRLGCPQLERGAVATSPIHTRVASGATALVQAARFNSTTAAYGTAVIGRGAVALTATAFVSASAAYGVAVVGRGAVALTATKFTSAAAAYGTAVVGRGAVALVQSARFDSGTAAYGTAAVYLAAGAQSVVATRFDSALAAYGVAVVGAGAVALTAAKFVSASAAYGVAVVGRGAVALTATKFTSTTAAYGTAVVAAGPTGLVATKFVSGTAAYGTAIVALGSQQLYPATFVNVATFGAGTTVERATVDYMAGQRVPWSRDYSWHSGYWGKYNNPHRGRGTV